MATTMTIYQFPSQKKLLREKTEEWGKECIEAGLTITNGDTSKIRKSRVAKQINYDLINGIIDESDIEKAFNPMGIKGVNFPAKIQNYPIELTKFNVLKGEEGKRRFEWRLRSVNPDVVSEKEFMMREQVFGLISQEITSGGYNEEQVARRLKQLQHYHNYEYQDYGEVMGQRILDYFWYTQKLKNIFSDAFYDVLVGAEEIYEVPILHGEPVVSKRNVLNISTFGGGDSYKIEDSEIIIDSGYVPIGKVIDDYWDVLTSDEIDTLEIGARENRFASNIVFSGPVDRDEPNVRGLGATQLITVDGPDARNFGGQFDSEGNIFVAKIVWKSRRKIGRLTYYDPKGDEQETIVDENFPIDQFKNLGWKIDWRWINEWWQGHKIGVDMYKRIESLPRIGSKFSNPSICLPPYIGTIYSIGGGTGVSLMDRVKPYKYLYNVYMRRTELASARNKGVIAELDLAEIPDGWDEELVMMYAEANGYMVTDSFKEGKKGIAQGKLLSTIKQRNSNVLNLNSSEVILANLKLAQYVKNELGEVAGITPQREGQIDNRETYGGVERSVTQSSHITEEWFRVHDNTKLRVLECLLETAKYAWKNATGENIKKLQYVDDGMITHLFEVDGRKFAETDYGYYISDGQNDAELIAAIKQLSLAALQNDKATFKDLFTIYRDTSVAGMIRKLEDSEEQRNQREDDVRKEQLESQERIQQALNELELMKLEQAERIENNRLDAEIYMKEMQIEVEYAKLGEDKDLGKITDDESEKREFELEKLRLQLAQRKEEMKEKIRQFNEKLKEQRNIVRMQVQSAEKIARSRPKPATIKK
ncbi:MAG: structural protein [candidate division TM6 bacterium GW2011_GWF2_33_332]|nr:MAG: structural protein [candidate division TM6 bacterium GW2011_GWF2_33_332]